MIIEVKISEIEYGESSDYFSRDEGGWVDIESLPDIIRKGDIRYGNVNEVTKEMVINKINSRIKSGSKEGTVKFKRIDTDGKTIYPLFVKYCVRETEGSDPI